MLNREWDKRLPKDSGQRVILKLSKAEQARKDVRKLLVAGVAEKLQERAPGLISLHKAIFSVFFLGIFGDRFLDEPAEPALDDEGGEVEIIMLLLAESNGVLDGLQEGEGRPFAGAHTPNK